MYLLQPHMQRFVTWKVIGMTITAEPSRHELADDFYQLAVPNMVKNSRWCLPAHLSFPGCIDYDVAQFRRQVFYVLAC
jgi:hypothetical protein